MLKRPPTSGTRKGNGAGHGGPATGLGQGDGWGGPTSGYEPKPAQQFTAENAEATGFDFTEAPKDRNGRAIPSSRRELKRRRAERMEDVLFGLADDVAQHPMVRLNAATKLHAIYEGQPVARNINANVDDVSQLSDDAIRDELARLSREATSPAEGDAAADLPGESGGLVH